jgi:mannitol/fructose-specific phosphotransferase system IIA component (Ntr-type)
MQQFSPIRGEFAVRRAHGPARLKAPARGIRFARFGPRPAGVACRVFSARGPSVLLSELLNPDRVKVPLQGATKEALLEELVGVLHAGGAVSDPAEVLRAVRAREEVLSTGIGSGVAIPHGKSNAAPELAMAAGVLPTPVEFEALDGEPVRLVFMLVGPESAAGAHVKALSRISRLVRREELRDRLSSVASAEEFLRVLTEAEET